jgi:hypothetical protein
MIYLLYETDAWKSNTNRVLVMVSTDGQRIRDILIKAINSNSAVIDFSEVNGKKGAEAFIESGYDYTMLKNGLVQVVKDGEILDSGCQVY